VSTSKKASIKLPGNNSNNTISMPSTKISLIEQKYKKFHSFYTINTYYVPITALDPRKTKITRKVPGLKELIA
jgi:hypothetical protein